MIDIKKKRFCQATTYLENVYLFKHFTPFPYKSLQFTRILIRLRPLNELAFINDNGCYKILKEKHERKQKTKPIINKCRQNKLGRHLEIVIR